MEKSHWTVTLERHQSKGMNSIHASVRIEWLICNDLVDSFVRAQSKRA